MEAVHARGSEQGQLCGEAAGMLNLSSALDQLAAVADEGSEKRRSGPTDDLNWLTSNPNQNDSNG